MTERVAIIGAGVAGLQVGRRLQAQGKAVELFDKARGPAGRIATRRLDFGRFDHGAQYFTARDPRFVAEVESWLARGAVARWDARIVTLAGGEVRPEVAPSRRHVGLPGMSGLARILAEGLTVQTGVRIASVSRQGSTWALTADDGRAWQGYDILVCAVPAPQAPPFLAMSSSLAQLVPRAVFQPCHAVMVDWAEAIDVGFDAAFVQDSPLGWVAREASKPGRAQSNAWLLHSTAAFSAANLELGDGMVEALTSAFAKALGRPLPAVAGAAVHRWLYARASQAMTDASPWDAALRLGVCGDWLVGDRVEDAYLSAERLVAAMGGESAVGAGRPASTGHAAS